MKLGYTMLPNLLLQAQGRLGISPVQLNVLVQLIQHWWDADSDPFLAKETIARRMRKGPRQIQRYLIELELAGLLKRRPRFKGHQAQTSNAYDLDGLVSKLAAIELGACERGRTEKGKAKENRNSRHGHDVSLRRSSTDRAPAPTPASSRRSSRSTTRLGLPDRPILVEAPSPGNGSAYVNRESFSRLSDSLTQRRPSV